MRRDLSVHQFNSIAITVTQVISLNRSLNSKLQCLLAEKVDVNLLDYRGATPLHRVKDIITMEVSRTQISNYQ